MEQRRPSLGAKFVCLFPTGGMCGGNGARVAVRDRWGTLYLQLLTGKKIHGRTLCVQVQERKILARRQRSTNGQRFQGCSISEISEQILKPHSIALTSAQSELTTLESFVFINNVGHPPGQANQVNFPETYKYCYLT